MVSAKYQRMDIRNYTKDIPENQKQNKLYCILESVWDGVVGISYGTPFQYSCLENPMDGGAW